MVIAGALVGDTERTQGSALEHSKGATEKHVYRLRMLFLDWSALLGADAGGATEPCESRPNGLSTTAGVPRGLRGTNGGS